MVTPLCYGPLETNYRAVKGATPSPQSIAPDQNNRQRQLRLPSRLSLCPSRFPGTFQRPSPSGGHLPLLLGFLNRFPLSRHSLRNPGSNIRNCLGAQLLLGLLAGLSFRRCPFDLRPSCDLSLSHLGPGVCTEFGFLGCFSRSGRSGYLAAQELTEFILQRLDLLLDVGCFTELCWCNIDHGAGVWMDLGWRSSRRTGSRDPLHDPQAYRAFEVKRLTASGGGCKVLRASWKIQ